MNHLNQVMFNELDRMRFDCVVILNEDLDEEDESDNDHPASDPDFSGTRRTNTTQSVILCPPILHNSFVNCSVRRRKDPATSVRLVSFSSSMTIFSSLFSDLLSIIFKLVSVL